MVVIHNVYALNSRFPSLPGRVRNLLLLLCVLVICRVEPLSAENKSADPDRLVSFKARTFQHKDLKSGGEEALFISRNMEFESCTFAPGFLEQVFREGKVKEVRFIKCALSDQELKALRFSPQLEKLTIAVDPSLVDDRLSVLEALPQLIELQLPMTSVKGNFLASIACPAKLKQLNLSGTLISDKNTLILERLPNLESLYLRESPFCNSASLLAIKPFQHLWNLDCGLRENPDEWIPVLSYHGVFKTGTSSLDLSETNLTDEGLAKLKNAGHISWLKLSETRITDAGLCAMESLPSLKVLILDKTRITDRGLACLSKHPELKRLMVQSCSINGEGFAAFANLPLEEIFLNGNQIQFSRSGMTKLGEMPQLNKLQITGCKLPSDYAFEDFESSGLSCLDISGNSITPQILEGIGKIRSLKYLGIYGAIWNKAKLEMLKELTQLKELNLHGSKNLNKQFVETILKLDALEDLDLTDTDISDANLRLIKNAKPGIVRQGRGYHSDFP